MYWLVALLLSPCIVGQEQKLRCLSKERFKSCYGTKELHVCKDQLRPMCSKNVSEGVYCPTCIPISLSYILCPVLELPKKVCEAGVHPIFKKKLVGNSRLFNICPNCVKKMENKCDIASRVKCAKMSMKSNSTKDKKCVDGEKPYLVDCCFSCFPSTSGCTSDDFKRCKANYLQSPECSADEPNKISNCCRTCKPAFTSGMFKRSDGKKCSFALFNNAREKIQECESNEKPVVSVKIKSCAASCRRRESGFDIKDVVDCLKLRKMCGTDETTNLIPGDRCKPCLRQRPVCGQGANRGCEEGKKVCVGGKSNSPKCVSRKRFKLRLQAKLKALADVLRGLKKDEVPRVILEFVERFCERNSQADRCAKFMERLADGLSCKKVTPERDDRSVEFELEVPEDMEQETSRRVLLADTESTQAFVEEAVKDNENDINFASTSKLDDESASVRTLVSPFVALLLSMVILY